MKSSITVIITSTLLIVIIVSTSFYAATQTPKFREVLFFEQLWGSSSAGGTAMALPWNAVGVPNSELQPYFKPLPRSFVLSRYWHSASSYFDQGESLWTFLMSDEVIRFGFNSSEPVYMELVSDQNIRIVHNNGTYSYSGIFKVAKGGLYYFDFQIDESVTRSVNATVSFRCFEAMNLESVKAPLTMSVDTTAIQVNASLEDSPVIAVPTRSEGAELIATGFSIYWLVALVILGAVLFRTYYIRTGAGSKNIKTT